jgi:DNA invertase Pin-like site-specific DNA recombinase
MSRPRRIGISYARFSDPKQGKGDSEDRQDRDYRDFCQRHNLTPLTEVFLDRGRSGYKDEHRKKGRLGVLIQYAKEGRFEPGSVIVIEAWDRLGRLRPDKQTALVAELLQTGVDIGICRLNDVFTESDFGTHKWTTLAVFIQLAYQESKQKAERLSASWLSRRQRARKTGAPMTGRVPAWLKLADGLFRPIPGRVAVVRRIFALAAAGYGHGRIIRALNAEGAAAFGPSGRWNRISVWSILSDRRVLGELQPTRDGKPDGQPIPGYYPAVVGEAEFALARAGQQRRTNGHGPKQRQHLNLFAGLLRHARDGSGFCVVNKYTAADPYLVLRNTTAEGGNGYTFPLAVFEKAILSQLRELNPRDVLPRREQGPSKAEVLRARLKNVRADLAAYQAELKAGGFSKALAAVLREKEIEEEAVAGELQEELSRQAVPLARDWEGLPGLVELAGTDDGRLRLAAALRRLVEVALVLIVPRRSYRFCAVQVFFTGGATRHYLILSQTAGCNRKGDAWAESLAAVADPADLDLRRREDARELEALLAGLDVGQLQDLLRPVQ